MKIIPAPRKKAWIEETTEGFAGRCLPMRMANQAGWVVLNDQAFRAIWVGGPGPGSISFVRTGKPPYAAISHFGHGILTFTLPFLFRTSKGIATLMRGPPNDPKDAIAPLEALVETDWCVATAAMSWRFTRPNTWVEFTRDEPICMIAPQRIDLLEDVRPLVLDIKDDPSVQALYEAWFKSRNQFNENIRKRDPKALKQGWQRHYFQGTAPRAQSHQQAVAPEHRTQLKLREFSVAGRTRDTRNPA